ncbi:uncharacterized protein LOC125236100 [Leguminivora glycinivorella]|uniref:uncharacterized protein LOC125236100 n=1 Tax=Leguminivora glycinivorella TaxID=1035111 RepID=UPI00200DE274|nr:uncharacterized protein LOC125236100 [Leguminivora glycinivorella]
MDDSTKTPAIASSSKLQNPEATTQITMTSSPIPMEAVPAAPVLAACSTTPALVKASAPNHEEDVALVPPSGSKTPLATSTRQNVLSPSPILMKKKQAHVPKLDAASTTKETLMDWDKSKEKLIRQLNKVKSTVRSLKRNPILLDRLESSLCNWR